MALNGNEKKIKILIIRTTFENNPYSPNSYVQFKNQNGRVFGTDLKSEIHLPQW